MIIVLEKENSVILDENGEISKIVTIEEESLLEENIIKELEFDALLLTNRNMNVI